MIGKHDPGHAVGIKLALIDFEFGAAHQLRVNAADAGMRRHPDGQLEFLGADVVEAKPVTLAVPLITISKVQCSRRFDQNAAWVWKVTFPRVPHLKNKNGQPAGNDVEAAIRGAHEKIPHASLVARENKGAWSYSTVWRVAARAGIEISAGRRTMGRPLPPEKRTRVEQAGAARPDAPQLELARQCGGSLSTVGRVMRTRRAATGLA